jgi:hypothetical protein
VDEHTAQQLAGHADGRMTREIYTHVTETMLKEAADTIERAVGGTDADADPNGSSSGSSDGTDPENDEGQEPGYGA